MKTCKKCGLESDDLNLFVACTNCPDGHGNVCKVCSNKHTSDRRKIRREFINSLKSGKPCYICGGMFPPYVMDYHHTDPDIKDNAVGNMISGNAPVERVLQEINKCILVCANCHRMLHYAEGDQDGNETK